jgi:hypothetical protein
VLLLAMAWLNICSCWTLDCRNVRNSYEQNAVVVTASTAPAEKNIIRIKVRRMGVDEAAMRQFPLRLPTISAGRSNFELIVRPAARADSTLMRSRIRLFSVVN